MGLLILFLLLLEIMYLNHKLNFKNNLMTYLYLYYRFVPIIQCVCRYFNPKHIKYMLRTCHVIIII